MCMWNCQHMSEQFQFICLLSSCSTWYTDCCHPPGYTGIPSSFSAWLWVGWHWASYEHISVAKVYVQKFQRNSCLVLRQLLNRATSKSRYKQMWSTFTFFVKWQVLSWKKQRTWCGNRDSNTFILTQNGQRATIQNKCYSRIHRYLFPACNYCLPVLANMFSSARHYAHLSLESFKMKVRNYSLWKVCSKCEMFGFV